MASSVFADSPVSSNESRMLGETQSDLVVVYGKKGVNVDSAELNNLLENRNISSVSVVRLTSPTPSMEEEEAAQHEDEGIGGDDSDLLSTLESRDSNDKPEIVGLTVEEFYPQDEAKNLAKEILDYAGVANPLQIKIDYEFQRFVIQNDHCYTPLTSPSQSKPQSLADSSSSAENKPSAIRQYNNANRTRKSGESLIEVDDKKNESDDDDDEEYSEYTDSSLSDSDNDRDSDLDFSVNDRGRRRKVRTKKTRKSLVKTPRKQRQSITEKDSQVEDEQKKIVAGRSLVRQPLSTQTVKAGLKAVVAVKTVARPAQRLSSAEAEKGQTSDQKTRLGQTNTIQKALQQQQHIQQRQLQQQQIQMQIQQQQHLIQQQIQQQQKHQQTLQQQQSLEQQQLQLQNEVPKPQVQKVYLLKKEIVPATRTVENPKSPPEGLATAKKIILIENQPDPRNQVIVTPAIQHAPPLSTPSFANQISTKGFMPLGVDTAAKNQLPAQISIQTHTSSTELAIENDKQLDLIDSIVKDEMQKPNVVMKHSQETNKDIPQIVKMLESTERAILNKKPIVGGIASTSTTSSSFTNPVEHFDIANADLLDNPDDDLYKDLLQHVAELRNDKQLQEVIEKQGYGVGTSSLTISDASNLIGLAQSVQQQGSVSISVSEAQQALERKETIKIVRGDGRVITLPPIEAPTTRAKRRAQSQHVGSSPLNSSKSGAVAVKGESMQRRESAENRGAATSKKRSSVSSSQSTQKEDGETEESQEEEDSEDDPNKLWCICRQPHNNRFMICCDKCEDWFHGTCVNITKAMGREMENSGKEWTCPNCIKDKKKPVQKKITEIFDKKPINEMSTPKSKPDMRKPAPITVRKSSTKKTSNETPGKNSTEQRKMPETIKTNRITSGPPPLVKSVEVIVTNLKVNESGAVQERQQSSKLDNSKINEPPLDCIVCRKRCRPNSIYCSDDCIRRHAQNALITVNKAAKAAAAAAASSSTTAPLTPDEKKKKTPSSFEEALARAADPTVQIKNKVERVYVFERKTGRILTGTNAPTTANLKKWLQENPTFEVVQPGSAEAMAIERSKQKHIKIGPLNVSAASIQVSSSPPSSAATPPPLKKLTEPKFELKQEMSLKLHKAQIVDVGKGPRANLVQNAFRSLPQFPSEGLNKTLKTSNPEISPRQPGTITPALKKYPQQVSIKPAPPQPPNETKTPSKTPRKLPTQPVEQKPTQPPEAPPKPDNEPIRLNVRKTLKEHLINRVNEVKVPGVNRLSTADIEHFATEVESEMFSLFNKDTGTKYKAKYRSLTFNIKDKKNDTLIQKILERKIEPRQLVRMSAEEMASQELTQWRQNENKHQLEMIKKSELDLLSCAKNYVLKTHKGEEVIESKSTDRVSLDITIPVEDVVTVLNNSTVSSTSEVDMLSPGKDSNRTQSMSDLSQDADSSYNATTESSKITNSNVSKEKKVVKLEKERDRHNRAKEKHKANRKRSRSRSRDRRHRSPHRDEKHKSPGRDDRHRSPTQEDKRKSPPREERRKSPHREERHRSPHYDERHKSPYREERNKSPNRDGGHKSPHRDEKRRSPHQEERHKSPHRTEKLRSPNRDLISIEKNEGAAKSFLHKKDDKKNEQHREKTTEKPVDPKTKAVAKNVTKPKEKERKVDEGKSKTEAGNQNFSLIDKIIESSKTVEEAANISSDKDKTESKAQPSSSAVSTTTTPSIESTAPSAGVKNALENSGGDSDQEPSSTVNIPLRPEDQYKKYVGDLSSIIWNGSINMIDVATFQIVIQPVTGITSEIEKQLPGELDVVGRISPETVWDYISKIKKSPNKEIVIVRLVPSCETENTAYFALYKYLNSRRRLGVVKTVSPNMKDFYILPLSAGKTLPTILRPQDTVDFFDDDARPDLLLGIIIRIMSKRSSMASGHHIQSKVARKSEQASVIANQSAASLEDYTPPTKKSEKSIISATRLPRKSDDSIDINAIINPTGKISKASYAADDADEPYSPGGSSDDDAPILSKDALNAGTATESLTDEDLKRKMDDINRQIEARKMEIAGMLGIDQSSSSFNSASVAECAPALANISIPSNLQQILASIKPAQETKNAAPPPPSIGPLVNTDKDEEYVPEATPVTSFKPLPPPPIPPTELLSSVLAPTANSSSSRLAQLSEAELLSMVPDGVDLGIDRKATLNSNKNEASSIAEPPAKRSRWIKEPPPPGLEEEFI